MLHVPSHLSVNGIHPERMLRIAQSHQVTIAPMLWSICLDVQRTEFLLPYPPFLYCTLGSMVYLITLTLSSRSPIWRVLRSGSSFAWESQGHGDNDDWSY
jgi:hypothetical protein